MQAKSILNHTSFCALAWSEEVLPFHSRARGFHGTPDQSCKGSLVLRKLVSPPFSRPHRSNSKIKEIGMNSSDFEYLKDVALFLGALFATLLLAAMVLWMVACHVVLWCKFYKKGSSRLLCFLTLFYESINLLICFTSYVCGQLTGHFTCFIGQTDL